MAGLMRRAVAAAKGVMSLSKSNSWIAIARFGIGRVRGSRVPLPLVVGDIRLMLRPANTDLNVARHCLLNGEFDILRQALPSGASFIIDGGGYIGTAAIALAKSFPLAKIVSVEPSPENFSILQQNVAPFANIIPVHAALVGNDRLITLYDRGTGDWGFTTTESPAGQPLPPAAVSISGLSVTSLIDKYGKGHVDILKLDIEGAEHEVFTHSQTWIEKIDCIFVELHDRIVPGCTETFLASAAGMRITPATGDKTLATRISPTIRSA